MESVVTIGNFDGVHLGHQQILRETLSQARQAGTRAVAFTFRPHPQVVLKPERAPSLLLTYDEKREVLLSLGVDDVFEQRFDLEFASNSPSSFFQQILKTRLAVRSLVVGYDFTFGKERSGHLQTLEHLCVSEGVSLTVVPPFRLDAEVVSSSSIRQALNQGRIHEAASNMGRPFFYRGTVISGDQRGRKLGFPTANLALDSGVGSKMILPHGVYATWLVWNGRKLPAVTNVGVRPTFGARSREPQVLVETHALEGAPDLYHQTIQVEFVDRIRGEEKFSSIAELQAQIAQDSARARQILG